MEFSGKELTQGEPDASSFPSGGLRATFEARGYTAWDCTSPVFVKEDGKNITLYIPSAFCSYTGEALDKKTPLLRSMDALSRQAVRVLRALGNTTVKRVIATMGPEQEYFLVDQAFCAKRLDLLLAGRTLFGAKPPRGQELEDHYFGSLHERVANFMNELNNELWKLGVSAKTQHNEVAPAQYELAPLFSTVNVAADHNQLTMDTLQKVARRHGFVCLLHEKPFAGVNGSGKHNNWSMATDTGVNLLDPGETPHDNMVFLVMLCAVVRAVDKYATLLRASVANAGNDHRLGANEAPPAIVSIFLGEQLTDIFEQLAKGSAKQQQTRRPAQARRLDAAASAQGQHRPQPDLAVRLYRQQIRVPHGRLVAVHLAGPSFTLNTIVADTLSEIADELEKDGDVRAAAQKILQDIATKHARIVFNGDNYSEEWTAEAARRGLPNIRSTVEALKLIPLPEHIALFTKHGVLSAGELKARTEIFLEVYSRQINVEAQTMLAMARRQILPACCECSTKLAGAVTAVANAGVKTDTQKALLQRVCDLIAALQAAHRRFGPGAGHGRRHERPSAPGGSLSQ